MFAPFVADEYQSFDQALTKFWNFNDVSKEKNWAGMATLIHYRCLLDFFYQRERSNRDKRDDNVLAVDYLPTWNPMSPEGKFPPWYKAQKEQCNKQLAHLSYSRLNRIKNGENEWELSNLQIMRKLWLIFLQKLPPDRLAWFPSTTDAAAAGTPSE